MRYFYDNAPAGSVRLYDGYMKNAAEREAEYLLALEADRLLAGFRETAGLDTKGAARYSGWENLLIGGHTMGHYIAACAQAYAAADTADSIKHELYRRLSYIFSALTECQENSKGKPGFIFGAKILDINNVEMQFDNVESGKAELFSQSWVPWYTLHKIIDGLVIAYELTKI